VVSTQSPADPADPRGYLLDTCVALWWQGESRRLTAVVRELLADPDTRLVFSLASLWEIRIKQSLGKLEVDDGFFKRVTGGSLEVLPMTAKHIMGVGDLPHRHGDPFDRMLVSQAMVEDLTVITADLRFGDYHCRVLPAT